MKKRIILNICMIFTIIAVAICGVVSVYSIKGRLSNNKEDSSLIICEKTGIVMIERNGISYEVREGMEVRESDNLYTKKAAALQIGKNGKSLISLDDDTEIVIKELGEILEIEVLGGEVFVDDGEKVKVTWRNAEKKETNGDFEVSVPDKAESDKVHTGAGDSVCILEIRCDTILDNMDNLKTGKEGYVPVDGIILQASEVAFQEGESVFEVLKRVCDNLGIQIEYSYTPIYESYYIEGINHLYEFDCGGQSGWMYKVNGEFPNYGCSEYKISPNDEIVWIYTCNGLGTDIGAKMGE